MKRLSLMMVCLVAVALTATAQPNPHYADMYEGNKLIGKQWISGGHARLERLRDDGTSTIMIYRADSAVIYTLNPERKVYIPLPMSQATDMNALIGAKVEEGRNVTRKFEGMEEVDGKMCSRYTVTVVTTLVNGSTETSTRSEWWWEPLNTFIRQQYGYSPAWELRNIRQGTQPANLFEIPNDYKAMNIPVGGIMEMLQQSSGKSQAEMQQSSNDANRKLEQINNISNDTTKTDEQKAQDLLKMLNSLKKK
jgi:hypothetical protein